LKNSLLCAGLLAVATFIAPSAKGGAILVAQCVEFDVCWEGQAGGTPWSSALTLTQLTALGLGTNVPLTAAETSEFMMQLGVTTMDFTTGSGDVIETLAEFTGGSESDPCDFCEIDTVGTFFIPANATGATISGTFGHSTTDSSAGMNVCLGTGAPCAAGAAVPEPATFGLVGTLLAGALAAVRLRRR
jgi:hypothetical protein